MKAVLRGCPFCSATEQRIVEMHNGSRVECQRCLAHGPWSWNNDAKLAKHDAIESWNGYVRQTKEIHNREASTRRRDGVVTHQTTGWRADSHDGIPQANAGTNPRKSY